MNGYAMETNANSHQARLGEESVSVPHTQPMAKGVCSRGVGLCAGVCPYCTANMPQFASEAGCVDCCWVPAAGESVPVLPVRELMVFFSSSFKFLVPVVRDSERR